MSGLEIVYSTIDQDFTISEALAGSFMGMISPGELLHLEAQCLGPERSSQWEVNSPIPTGSKEFMGMEGLIIHKSPSESEGSDYFIFSPPFPSWSPQTFTTDCRADLNPALFMTGLGAARRKRAKVL